MGDQVIGGRGRLRVPHGRRLRRSDRQASMVGDRNRLLGA